MAITAAELLVKIGADTGGAERGMQSVSAKLADFGKSATIAGGMLTAGLTLPLVGVAKAGVEAATGLDREMRNIQSISKATDEEIAALSETFVRMSMDVSVTTDSAQKLAAGFYDIQSSGFAGADAMTVLQASTKAASAGLTDTAVASKAITAVLNAYGMSADQATRVSDTLFRTVDIGVVSFEELATNLGDVVGTGAVAGVTIEELGAAFATMTKGGISAAESATALNQLMLSFISPSKAAAGAAVALGVDLSAAALQSKGLAGVMAEVTQKTGGSVEALSALFPNVRALKAALSLTRGEMGPFAEDLATIGTAAGATQAAFEIQTRSFAAQMASFQNTLQGLFIGLGQIILPVLTDLIAQIKPVIDQIMGLDEGTKRLIVTIGAVAAAAGPVLLIIGGLAAGLGALLSPIGLVIAALAALGAAYATNFGGMRDAVDQLVAQAQAVWPAIQTTITTAVQTIQTVIARVFTAIQEFWYQHGDEILTFARTVWGAIQQFVDLAVRNISDIVTTVMATVQKFWDENGQQIMEATQIVWNRIWQIISTIMHVIQTIWRDHGEQILHVAQNVWNSIKVVIETMINVILGIIKLVTSLIRGDWEGAWEAIRGIAESVWNGIYRIISNLLDSIKTIIFIALDSVRPLWERVWGGIQDTTERIWEGIVSTVRNAINSIIRGINSLITAWNRLEFRIPGFGVDIPKVDIPGIGTVGGGHLGWPGITIGTPDIPTIPLLAAGGLVTRPTLAMLGEQGPEAVLPLDRLDVLAERIAAAVAGRPTYTINAQYRYQDERSLRDDLRLLQLLGVAI